MKMNYSIACNRSLLVCLGLAAASQGMLVSNSHSAPIVVTKQVNSIETSLNDALASAFFTSSPDGLIVLTNIATTMTPGLVGATVAAGDAASSVSTGTFTIVGDSTSVGGWTDSNGVPAGITVSFKIQFTTSTPDAGSFLTTQGNASTQLGNGIGIAQVADSTGSLNAGERLEISTIAISDVAFSGSIAEPGFIFAPGTVSNPKWNRMRSNNLDETTEGATVTVGSDVWGFGLSTGTVESGLAINNNYTAPSSTFATAGPMLIETQTGSWTLKGLGFQYEVSYDIVGLVLNPPTVSGTDITLIGTGPASGTYSILTSATLDAPASSWSTNTTGTFDSSGIFTNTVSMVPNAQRFFMLKIP